MLICAQQFIDLPHPPRLFIFQCRQISANNRPSCVGWGCIFESTFILDNAVNDRNQSGSQILIDELSTYNYSRPKPFQTSMTPFHLIAALLNLRILVQDQVETNVILKSIDSISNQAKHLCQIEEEVSSLRSQAKKMRTKTKKLEKKICLCSKQRDSLAGELQKAQQIHTSKLQKMKSYINQSPPQSNTIQGPAINTQTCWGVQCQIITQSQIIELNENYKNILTKLQILQQRYDDLYLQNKAKDIYISQLLLALQASPTDGVQSDDQKSNDDSTLDDNSQKPDDQEMLERQEEGQPTPRSCWFSSVFDKSLKLYSFIFS